MQIINTHGIFTSNEKTAHYIYLDNNIFRRLKRYPVFFNDFIKVLEKFYPEVCNNFEFIFTWSQLIEDLDLGNIINYILEDPLYTQEKYQFADATPAIILKSLERLFNIACNVIQQRPELQREALLKSIDDSMNFAHSKDNLLMQQTLLKCRKAIDDDSYMDDLKYEIAWAIISSYNFISTPTKWEQRKGYFDQLIAFWHQLFLQGHELNIYRLLERRYHDYVEYGAKINNGFKQWKLKERSDLCDGELISYVVIGVKNGIQGNRNHVIVITEDNPYELKGRLDIAQQSLADLKRDVEDWDISTTPGKILSLKVEDKDHKIAAIAEVPFALCELPYTKDLMVLK